MSPRERQTIETIVNVSRWLGGIVLALFLYGPIIWWCLS